MKYTGIFFSIVVAHFCAYATESPIIDPFVAPNTLYANSEWKEAYHLYSIIFQGIDAEETWMQYNMATNKIEEKKIDTAALIRGHVNFGDVTFAKAVRKLLHEKTEEAKKLMLQACSHWTWRLQGGQFGRKPLDNEWDGSDIAEETLLVYSERDAGAFGDTFFMTAMLQYVKEQGATVIFVPQKPLANLYDKTKLPSASQTHFVDQVALRGTELPHHDKAIYLWSILKHYLNDPKTTKPFPLKPCLSGAQCLYPQLLQRIADLKQQYGYEPLLVGMWWRSSGSASLAADWRTLDRDPGAHRMLSTVQDLPVLVINLQGMGRFPLSEEKLQKRTAKGTHGNSDEIDITTYPTHNVHSFGPGFDREIAFRDTLTVMKMIKYKNGILMGPDTSILNAAAMLQKDTNPCAKPLVFAILNKQADFRWGATSKSPRTWSLSDDVLIFQAQQQGQWEGALAQAREEIKNRIENFKQQQK